MSNPVNELEFVEKKSIRKTAAYNSAKSGFNMSFLQNVLSIEIKKLIELQNDTIGLLETMIEDLKKRPLNGGSE